MSTISSLNELSKEEKLRMMEALWDDLSQDGSEIVSPDWHADELRETALRLESGKENTEDWDSAKKALRKRFE